MKTLDRFHLHYQAAVHEYVDPEVVANPLAPIHNRHRALPFHPKPVCDEFYGEAVLVDRFEQPGTKSRVNRNSAPDHELREFVDCE